MFFAFGLRILRHACVYLFVNKLDFDSMFYAAGLTGTEIRPNDGKRVRRINYFMGMYHQIINISKHTVRALGNGGRNVIE